MLVALFILALSLTLVSLIFGLASFFSNGKLKKYANLAMRWRVLLQGITLLIFLVLLWLK